MPPKIARFAGLGAFGACAGLFALYLLIAWVSRPTRTGGIEPTLSWVTWIALAGVFAALIIVHVAIGRQLLLLSRGPEIRRRL
ncbi:MAG TPA: hypothetical protein VJ867_06355 [Gemmatimonadaceae bacterium]|nr:hypothetical protein [Gemmatimonadaceae bacterium]